MTKEPNPEKLREKITAGLTHDQALEVLERQSAHDAQASQGAKTTETFAAGAIPPRRQQPGASAPIKTKGDKHI